MVSADRPLRIFDQRQLHANYIQGQLRSVQCRDNQRFPDDQKDFVTNPDPLLSNLEYGVESAFDYWTVNRDVNSVADTGDVAAVT